MASPSSLSSLSSPKSSSSRIDKAPHHDEGIQSKSKKSTRCSFSPLVYLVLGLLMAVIPFCCFHTDDGNNESFPSSSLSSHRTLFLGEEYKKNLVQKMNDAIDGNEEKITTDWNFFRKHQEQNEESKLQKERRLQQQPFQPSIRRYTYYDSIDVYNKLLEFQEKYPEFVTLTNAQDYYNLPRAGTNDDCSYEPQKGCSNWIVTIEDPISNPPPSLSGMEDITNAAGFTKYEALPEVFLTAGLHGNDRIGPTVLMEVMEMMLESAWCESLPRMRQGNDGMNNMHDVLAPPPPPSQPEEEEQDLEEARYCREALASKGIFGRHRRWLSRLVTTRRIVIVPVANSLGYYRNSPLEGGAGGDDNRKKANFDPSFDFPFDVQSNKEGQQQQQQQQQQCMNTIAARTINEVFRQHMFQLGVSFHNSENNNNKNSNSNEEVEGVFYEWGTPSYKGHNAPDEISMIEIADSLSGYGGPISNAEEEEYYPIGQMNELLYPNVGGRMEDWAYAGSWDNEKLGTCHPTSYGGYNESKTIYDASTLRSFHALVETTTAASIDNMKMTPLEEEEELGTTEDLFTPYGGGNGHISRNIRLSLSTIDLVEPYVTILGIDNYDFRDDIIPLMPRTEQSCRRTKVMKIPEKRRGKGNVTMAWTVGGAFTVDSTAIMYGKWSDLDIGGFFDCMTQPTKEELDVYFDNLKRQGDGPMALKSTVRFTQPKSGVTRWHKNVPYPPPESWFLTPSETVFEVDLDLSQFKQGDLIAVYAVARVDQGWKTRPNNVYNNLHPQSHIVNARTNPDWFHEREGKVIQGRIDWFSIPMTIEIGYPSSNTVDKSVRSPDEEWEEEIEEYNQMSTFMLIKMIFYTAFLVAMVVACCFCREESDGTDVCSIWRERRRIEKATRVQIDELYEDDDDEGSWFSWFKFRRRRKMEGQGGGRFEMANQTIT